MGKCDVEWVPEAGMCCVGEACSKTGFISSGKSASICHKNWPITSRTVHLRRMLSYLDVHLWLCTATIATAVLSRSKG